MYKQFSQFGVKWEVNDEGLVYLKRTYYYKDMESVKITREPSIISNGGALTFYLTNGPCVTVAYKKNDHDKIIVLVKDLSRLIELNNTSTKTDAVYSLHGARGKHMYIYEDHCCIKSSASFTTLLVGNATDGAKDIYYSDVVGIQCKAPSITLGYIQLETPSLMMNNGNSNFFNENTFTYNETDLSQEKANEIIAFLKKKISEYKQNRNMPNTCVSNADEILKYKQLLDLGAITQEEFEKKKQELL